jgi:hypothetical protein
LLDEEIKNATSTFVFCASDYVGVIGGIEVLKCFGITIDVIAGSVTDSQAGEDFIVQNFGIKAGNARRNGLGLFELLDLETRKFETRGRGDAERNCFCLKIKEGKLKWMKQ